MKHEITARIEITDGQPEIVIETRTASGRIALTGNLQFSKLRDGDSVNITIETDLHPAKTDPTKL